jgi:uncharacterized protein (DUF1800 family)
MPSRSVPNRQIRFSGRSLIATLLVVQIASPMYVPGQQTTTPQQTPAQTPTPQTQTAPPVAPQRPLPDPAMDQQAGTGMQQPGQAPDATGTPLGEAPSDTMAPFQATVAATTSPLSRDEQYLMVLSRFANGPRPGDLARLREEGLSKWFTAQLNPWHIDDSDLERRLDDYPAMKLPISKLMEMYPDGGMIRQVMNGKNYIPSGEGEKALYNSQMDRYKEKKAGKDATDSAGDNPTLPEEPAAYLAMDPHKRFNELCKLSPALMTQLRKALPAEDRDKLTEGFTPHELEVLAAFNGPANVVSSELVQTKLLRDIYSERQLNEVMVDFWLNHFNVYLKKSQQAPYFITAFERDTIRPRALGNFESLLIATALSPAMLNYLDNEESVGPHSDKVKYIAYDARGRFIGGDPKKKGVTGLNENYARELMELHTVGVNGGYTQHDVTEVAKVFTGWTLSKGYDSEAIHPTYDQSKHEPGDKMVMGVKIKWDGMEEGLKVLHMLANSPQTAHFVSYKLAVRFASDNPPAAMVTRMSMAFLESHGDIRHVLIAMINSPEFFSRETYRAKVKTPQDYVVSAVRAAGAEVDSAASVAAAVSDLGMPVYGRQTPDGYPMKAEAWNNTADLVSRMNFALALSSNRVGGVHTDWASAMGNSVAVSAEEKDKLLEEHLLHMDVSARTRQTILGQINAPVDQQQTAVKQISAKNGGRDPLTNLRLPAKQDAGPIDAQTVLAAGLILGSPEFQRR